MDLFSLIFHMILLAIGLVSAIMFLILAFHNFPDLTRKKDIESLIVDTLNEVESHKRKRSRYYRKHMKGGK